MFLPPLSELINFDCGRRGEYIAFSYGETIRFYFICSMQFEISLNTQILDSVFKNKYLYYRE